MQIMAAVERPRTTERGKDTLYLLMKYGSVFVRESHAKEMICREIMRDYKSGEGEWESIYLSSSLIAC